MTNINNYIGWIIWILLLGLAFVHFRIDPNKPAFERNGLLGGNHDTRK